MGACESEPYPDPLSPEHSGLALIVKQRWCLSRLEMLVTQGQERRLLPQLGMSALRPRATRLATAKSDAMRGGPSLDRYFAAAVWLPMAKCESSFP